MKVPDVKTCCFCFPLRGGIVFFGVVNTILSLLAVVRLVMSRDLHTPGASDMAYMEMVTTTILLSIFGMGVILNILLLIGGCQKDPSLMRLYNCYALATILAALVPSALKLYRVQYLEVSTIVLAIAMQCYVVLLVRSEIIKLEKKQSTTEPELRAPEIAVEVPDSETLL